MKYSGVKTIPGILRVLILSGLISPTFATPEKTSENIQTTALTTEVIPLDIWFGEGKTILKRGPHNAPVLKKLASALKQPNIIQIEIEGNPDPKGAPEINKYLSLKRAEALRDSLPDLYGIATERVQVVATGEGVPSEKRIASKPDLPLPLYLILYRLDSGNMNLSSK